MSADVCVRGGWGGGRLSGPQVEIVVWGLGRAVIRNVIAVLHVIGEDHGGVPREGRVVDVVGGAQIVCELASGLRTYRDGDGG